MLQIRGGGGEHKQRKDRGGVGGGLDVGRTRSGEWMGTKPAGVTSGTTHVVCVGTG